MNSHDIDLVTSTIKNVRPSRSGWGRTKCPFCITKIGKEDRRGSFAFYFPYGYFKCFRCGTKGTLKGFKTDYKKDDFSREVFGAKKDPQWFIPLWGSDALHSLTLKTAVDYCENRGFDLGLRQSVGVGAATHGKYAGRIIIPHKNKDRSWWGFTGRRWYKKCASPYMYPDGMSRDNLFNDKALHIKTEDPVLLMEGVCDGILYWPDCVCCLGKPIEEHIRLLKRATRPIAVVLDGDAWKEAEMFTLRLRLEGITAGAVRLPPGRDPNDSQIDPSALRRAAFASLTNKRPITLNER